MKILVAGAAGQVGRELVEFCITHDLDVIACNREDLDISNRQKISEVVQKYSPSIIVNAAAYTAVDKAEEEEEKESAWAINSEGVKNLALVCSEENILLVHISTDYVFDGEKPSAYVEDDSTNPLGEYGKSKLAGELAIQKLCADFYILRTSWVFGQYGNNFVKTMLRLAQKGNPLRVVSDQKGTPTPALMIAEAIVDVIKNKVTLESGIYHISGMPEVTWHEFACSIIDMASRLGMCEKVDVQPITTAEFPTPAKRPQNSCLDSRKLFEALNLTPRSWNTYLKGVLVSMQKEL
ncbi:MAG: dTDP-4-dehydrorhamnose reductase [Cellvibrionaceae bacterium]